MTAEAAGVLLAAGIGDMIIFSGGHTAGPMYPTEASKMSDTMYSHFNQSKVPTQRVALEEESYDTLSNLRNVKELMPGLGIDNLILLTIGYHLPRVKRLARILDIPVSETFKSDYVIRERRGGSKHTYAKQVIATTVEYHTLKPLVRTASMYALEAAGWALSLADPEGKNIASAVTSRMRHEN